MDVKNDGHFAENWEIRSLCPPSHVSPFSCTFPSSLICPIFRMVPRFDVCPPPPHPPKGDVGQSPTPSRDACRRHPTIGGPPRSESLCHACPVLNAIAVTSYGGIFWGGGSEGAMLGLDWDWSFVLQGGVPKVTGHAVKQAHDSDTPTPKIGGGVQSPATPSLGHRNSAQRRLGPILGILRG